uniref:Uncharacterized protein n=1 Tax=Anguilla anguilla TaxID=7936 RepID=A0A0E9UY78_ANGAN
MVAGLIPRWSTVRIDKALSLYSFRTYPSCINA